MLTCELNPPASDEEYLRAVNLCFPGWGDRRQLAWALSRSVGGPLPDRMLLRLSGTLVAGSAVSYRWLERGGTRLLIGIMTGSWTLPEARGQGCFTRIIQESVAAAANQGAALLLAFVTEDNPSYRRLRDAGAATFSTTYFHGRAAFGRPGPAVEAVGLDEALEAGLLARHSGLGGDWTVLYDLATWRGQLVDRARKSTAVRIGEDAFALLDQVPGNDTTRLLALYPGSFEPGVLLSALANGVSGYGHTLTGFAGDHSLASAARASGFECRPGHMTAMAADSEALGAAIDQSAPWSGRHSDLAEPTNPWFLGRFAFHSGDRM